MIARADFDDPALATFLAAHHAEMAPTAPPESQHALGLDELRAPHVRLWTLHDDGALVGTVALAELEPGHEELKSMRAAPQVRGRGIGRRLLAFALDDARSRGVRRISLETREPGLLRPGPSALRGARIRAVRPVRLLPRGPEQRLPDMDGGAGMTRVPFLLRSNSAPSPSGIARRGAK